MIPQSVFQRVFRIAVGDSGGTAFALDVDGREYLITARHVLPDDTDAFSLAIARNNQWISLSHKVVGRCPGDIDIAILAPNQPIAPAAPLPFDGVNAFVGQDMYFLGYPHGWSTEIGAKNNGFPLPYVKKAIFSGIAKSSEGTPIWLLDGHNNRGFSGGPVVFCPPGQFEKFAVTGVVSAYRVEHERVRLGEDETELVVPLNSGIVVTCGLAPAIELIRKNPIGPSRAAV